MLASQKKKAPSWLEPFGVFMKLLVMGHQESLELQIDHKLCRHLNV